MAREQTIVHDWDVDGWDNFTERVISAHNSQEFVQGVADGAGTLTPSTTDGSHRMAYLLGGSYATDAEFKTLFLQPTRTGDSGSNFPQLGHIHRVRRMPDGTYEGIAVWTGVVGGQFDLLNISAVHFDGTTLEQVSNSTYGGATYLDNQASVIGYRRVDGFDWSQVFLTDEADVVGYPEGATFTVAGVHTDADGTHEVLESHAGRPSITWTDATVGDVDVDVSTVGAATVTPSGASKLNRYAPFWMATRVRGGDRTGCVVEIKRWRASEGEPSWTDARVQRMDVEPNAYVSDVPSERGQCAVWVAHAVSTNTDTVRLGPVEWKSLD